jgi:hypothetical protein
MDHSLINPNQIRESGIPVYDNPFSQSQFGINCNDDFIPFNTMGAIVYLSLMCQQIGKLITCRLLCLQMKNDWPWSFV